MLAPCSSDQIYLLLSPTGWHQLAVSKPTPALCVCSNPSQPQDIISYPISDCRDFNMVLNHFQEQPVDSVQDVSLKEVKDQYKGYDPRIKRVIDMIKSPISRWPLLVTGPLDTWSNAEKNIVLIGDACHSMVNHMAQGWFILPFGSKLSDVANIAM